MKELSLWWKLEEASKKGGVERYISPFISLKDKVHRSLIDKLEKVNSLETINKEILEKEVEERLLAIASNEQITLTHQEYKRIKEEIINEILGFGPIEPLLHDDSVTEIMVNGPFSVYVERYGKLQLTNIKFHSSAHLLKIIHKILGLVGRRIDESMPYVDARLPDGSRVNAIIPPLSLIGPVLTIRKFYRERLTMEDLINFHTLTPIMAEFLASCVKAKLNIVVSGGTGSGKTTTLNVLSSFISSDERIITLEDAAELRLHQQHVIPLETRPPNIEGKGEVTTRALLKNALRMRPDRIIIGEARGGEALDMLQAMNTGHEGSLTTVHSNSARDTLARIETMTLMAGVDLPSRAIREQIASAIQLIVHQARFKDGSRKITSITEIQGMEGDTITLQDIFLFKQEGIIDGKVKGKFIFTGLIPKFYNRFKEMGINFSFPTTSEC
jgi:pilus assembly protein CpaF